jgi:hypothetical protein
LDPSLEDNKSADLGFSAEQQIHSTVATGFRFQDDLVLGYRHPAVRGNMFDKSQITTIVIVPRNNPGFAEPGVNNIETISLLPC